MTTILFRAYPENVTNFQLYRSTKGVQAIGYSLVQSCLELIEKRLSIDENIFFDPVEEQWEHSNGRFVCHEGDLSADMGDYTLYAKEFPECNEDEIAAFYRMHSAQD